MTEPAVIPPAAQEAMCHGKRLYLDEGTARMHLGKAERKTGKPMRAYQCPNCRFWHLTTRPA